MQSHCTSVQRLGDCQSERHLDGFVTAGCHDPPSCLAQSNAGKVSRRSNEESRVVDVLTVPRFCDLKYMPAYLLRSMILLVHIRTYTQFILYPHLCLRPLRLSRLRTIGSLSAGHNVLDKAVFQLAVDTQWTSLAGGDKFLLFWVAGRTLPFPHVLPGETLQHIILSQQKMTMSQNSRRASRRWVSTHSASVTGTQKYSAVAIAMVFGSIQRVCRGGRGVVLRRFWL